MRPLTAPRPPERDSQSEVRHVTETGEVGSATCHEPRPGTSEADRRAESIGASIPNLQIVILCIYIYICVCIHIEASGTLAVLGMWDHGTGTYCCLKTIA